MVRPVCIFLSHCPYGRTVYRPPVEWAWVHCFPGGTSERCFCGNPSWVLWLWGAIALQTCIVFGSRCSMLSIKMESVGLRLPTNSWQSPFGCCWTVLLIWHCLLVELGCAPLTARASYASPVPSLCLRDHLSLRAESAVPRTLYATIPSC